ncbi:uncharacterized protein YybS (DUF2232 family) [Caldicoprobacter guelmensis]|uniref:DUF2232 domain-containing protein n=1 Tax=Caldicoprobacter guelmensis TaxID=1170224 RepID=UPI00195C351D|nr:DUF2232 domain-containing protein [Caldicoprobacter guelmensis]MBM7582475.1 uncharacterized protein YybS (DUF2232 family) [Caldicoprobacter guelmensis]
MNLKLKVVLESALLAAVSAVLLVILSFIPVLNVIILIWPVPFIVQGVRREPWAGILGLMVASVLLGIVFHPFVGFAVFLMNFPLVAVLAWTIKRRFDLFEYIVISTGAVLGSALAFLKAFSWFTGQTVFEYIANSIRRFFSSNILDFSRIMDLYAQLKMVERSMSAAEFAEVIIGQLEQFMPLVPSAIIIFSLLYGTMNLLVSHMALKKLGYVLDGLPEFSEWMLPKGAGLGFMAMLLVAYVGTLLHVKNFEVVFYTVLSVCSFVFSIQGMAVLMFFMKLKMSKVPQFLRAVIVAVLFMIAPMLLMSIGVLEQVFRLRSVYRRMN